MCWFAHLLFHAKSIVCSLKLRAFLRLFTFVSNPENVTLQVLELLHAFLPARRYTSPGSSYGCVSVCQSVCYKSLY